MRPNLTQAILSWSYCMICAESWVPICAKIKPLTHKAHVLCLKSASDSFCNFTMHIYQPRLYQPDRALRSGASDALPCLSAWISWCSHATMRWIWRMQNYAGSPFPRSSWTLNQKQAAMTFLDINWYVSTNDNFNIYKRLTGIPLLMVSRIHHMSMKTLAYT